MTFRQILTPMQWAAGTVSEQADPLDFKAALSCSGAS